MATKLLEKALKSVGGVEESRRPEPKLNINIEVKIVRQGEYLFRFEVPSPPTTSEEEKRLPIHNSPSDAAGLKMVLIPEVSAGVF